MQTQRPALVRTLSRSILPAFSQGKRSKGFLVFALLNTFFLLLMSSGLVLFQLVSHSNVAHAAAPAPANTAVLSFKNDLQHTGLNPNETILNTNNVNVNQFGKRVTYPVQGQVYAQPLFVPNLTIGGVSHNVVIVATEHDQVYAFDADQTSPTAPLWESNYLINGATSVAYTTISCSDMIPEVGITSTPEIDPATNTMYLVAFTNENGSLVYRLHAVDITTGLDKGTPIVLQGSVPGTGSGAVNGTQTFNPLKERQRAALVMTNNQIYIPFGSFCDSGPYQGWIMGYSYNGSTFQQKDIYNTNPNGSGGGIWGAGGALAADTSGNLYAATGNGDFNLNTGGIDAGDTVLKLNAQLQTQDYFAPFNAHCLQLRDADLASGGPLILPSLNEVITGGKEGRIYVLNSTNMGKFTTDPTLDCTSTTEVNRTDVDKVTQELPPGTVGGIYGNPSYYNGPNGRQYVYVPGSGSATKVFPLGANGILSAASSQTSRSFGFTGGNPIVSSNSTTAGTGVVWIIDPNGGLLRAYDATDLTKELYNSNQNAARDALGSYVKFSIPTVANGETFVGTGNSLVIYGLNPTTPNTTPTPTPTQATFDNVGSSNDSAPQTGNFDGNNHSYSVDALQGAGTNPGDNTFYNPNGMVFTWPNALAGQPNNYIASGQTIPVTPLANVNLLGFLGAASSGPSSGSATVNYADGGQQAFTLGFSDWTLNGGKSTPSFGNGIQAQMSYNNSGGGTTFVNTDVFYTDVAIDPQRTVVSVTLPKTVSQGQLHVFAVSTKSVPTPGVYNNAGISDDAKPQGSFDGANSYSVQALQAAGITAGGTVNFNGVSFTWPSPPAGSADNYQAAGQLLTITPVSSATTLSFIGASTSGNSSGTATITYTDNSTQTFTLGFNDWTRGGSGTDPIAFGDQLVASLAYRNNGTTQDAVHKPFLFYAEVALTAGKTLKSVTLPQTITGGQLHVFSVATKTGGTIVPTPTPTTTVPTPTPTVATTVTPTATPTTPPPAFNNIGTSDDTLPGKGNFDGANSYSAEALAAVGINPGAAVSFNGAVFTWPASAAGSANNYVSKGQVIPLSPVSNATTLAFLGSSTSGKTSGTATVMYTDGTTQTFTLGFNDWTLGGNGTDPLAFGDQLVATTAYRNTSAGPNTAHKPVVLYMDVALTAGKTVQSVTLPSTTTGGQIHVFSVVTKGGTTVTPTPTPTVTATATTVPTTTPVVTPTPTPAVYNNIGTSDDAARQTGNFDGTNSYSAQGLSQVGIVPGSVVTFNGVSFTWPSAASGANNNYIAKGQVLPVRQQNGTSTTTLAFLGAASAGNTSGVATINYTDGTTQTFTLGFNDWTRGGNGTDPLVFGDQVVATTAYRNTPTGGADTAHQPVVFYADVTITAGKTVQSVTLPTTVTGGQLHIFTVATK